MAREVFVDAGAWIAVMSRRDQYHTAAVDVYSRLLRDHRMLVTTNLVVAEAYTGIRRYVPLPEAGLFLDSLRNSGRVLKVYSDEELELEAEQTLRKCGDHDLSLVDAVSFALMRHRNITEAFSFDRRFVAGGFVLLS